MTYQRFFRHTASRSRAAAVLVPVLALVLAPSAQARPGWGGGYDGWGDPYGAWGGAGWQDRAPGRIADPREGRVEVSRFIATGADTTLREKGPVRVESRSGEGPFVNADTRLAYEAAIESQLVKQGYDTQHPNDTGGETIKLSVSRQVLVPAEEKRSPVSGSAAISTGTYGTSYGLAVNIDMTKPRGALVSTRMDVRITDGDSGKTLWEGYATIATREGDDSWNDTRIAGKLAEALFDRFPEADQVVPVASSDDGGQFVPAVPQG